MFEFSLTYVFAEAPVSVIFHETLRMNCVRLPTVTLVFLLPALSLMAEVSGFALDFRRFRGLRIAVSGLFVVVRICWHLRSNALVVFPPLFPPSVFVVLSQRLNVRFFFWQGDWLYDSNSPLDGSARIRTYKDASLLPLRSLFRPPQTAIEIFR